VRFHVDVNERIVLISDGISEAENRAEQEFGTEELGNHLSHCGPIQEIFTAVNRFCEGALPHDDRTMLTIDRLV
jgi:serine phosphatase RsbU (regulator of sigma subunit)